MLTRRRDPDAMQETWLIYYGDVHAGTIAMRSSNPTDTDPWRWRCGFYPGSEPGECKNGHGGKLRGSALGRLGATSATGRRGNMPYGRPASSCRRNGRTA
jgi:hypothetical protein